MERIKQIYKEKEDWCSKYPPNNLFLGLEILNKYATKEVQINPAHDLIYAGLDEVEYDKMDDANIHKMFELGWHIEDDSFAIFT